MLITKKRGSRAGSALVGATFVVVLVAALSMCYLQITTAITRERQVAVDAKRSFYMAEAGLSEAVMAVASGKTGSVGAGELPAAFGNGLFFVESEDLGGGQIRLKSTGLAGRGRHSLEVVVDVNDESFPSLGAFGDEEVSLGNGAVIDNFDPTVTVRALEKMGGGAPESQSLTTETAPPPVGGKVGSNGDIVLDEYASIEGDAVPGVSGYVQLGPGATVSGASAPRPEPASLPEVNVPALESQGDLVVTSGQEVTIPAGNVRYANVTVQPGGVLNVTGPGKVVFDNLDVEPSGNLSFDGSGGSLSVFVTQSLELDSGAQVSTASQDAGAVNLIVTVNNIDAPEQGGGLFSIIPPPPPPPPPATFESTGVFYGFLYAPNAAVALPNTFEVYGGIAARRLALGDSASLHIDMSMVTEAAQGGGGVPEIVSWRVDELPSNNALVQIRLDPIKLLDLLGRTPIKSDAAHDYVVVPDGKTIDDLLTLINIR